MQSLHAGQRKGDNQGFKIPWALRTANSASQGGSGCSLLASPGLASVEPPFATCSAQLSVCLPSAYSPMETLFPSKKILPILCQMTTVVVLVHGRQPPRHCTQSVGTPDCNRKVATAPLKEWALKMVVSTPCWVRTPKKRLATLSEPKKNGRSEYRNKWGVGD